MKKVSALCALLVLASCDSDDSDRSVRSDDVATSRIYASFQVLADGYGEVVVEAQLTEQLPPGQTDDADYFLHLSGGDELWLSRGPLSHYDIELDDNLFDALQDFSDDHVDLDSVTTIRESFNFLFLFSWISEFGRTYSAYLDQKGDSEFSVSFTRDSGDDVYTSTVELPEDFSLISPLVNDDYSRADDAINISWDNSLDNVDVQISVVTTCNNGVSSEYTATETADLGVHEIPAAALDMPELSGRCVATLSVSKINTLPAHPAFAGGVITGHQLRRVSFVTLE